MMFYRLLPDKAGDKRFYPPEADLPTHSADGLQRARSPQRRATCHRLRLKHHHRAHIPLRRDLHLFAPRLCAWCVHLLQIER